MFRGLVVAMYLVGPSIDGRDREPLLIVGNYTTQSACEFAKRRGKGFEIWKLFFFGKQDEDMHLRYAKLDCDLVLKSKP